MIDALFYEIQLDTAFYDKIRILSLTSQREKRSRAEKLRKNQFMYVIFLECVIYGGLYFNPLNKSV